MENEFVNYNQALSLKDLGFDEPCMASRDMNNDAGLIQIPLKQQAFRWFREKHNLLFYIYQQSNDTYRGVAQIDNKSQLNHVSEDFKTYEEAEQACLDKLIEICKTK